METPDLPSVQENSGRIVLVMHDFPAKSPFLLNKLVGLQREGLDVHVICVASGAVRRVRRQARVAGVNRGTVHAAWPESRSLAVLLFPILLLRCLVRNPRATLRYWTGAERSLSVDTIARFYFDGPIVALNPDVIHFEYGTLAAERIYLREILECEVVVSFRGYDLNYVGLKEEGYYDEVWAEATILHLLGRDLWHRAVNRGCSRDKPRVFVPPAIDTDFFSNPSRAHDVVAGSPRRPLRVVSVGRLVWKKGYEYALEAVKRLVDRGVPCEYHIIGDGKYREAIAFAADQMNISDCVRLLGRQPPERVRRELEWADVMLHAAVSEGFCNAVVEAQAMQLPVVCTDADGLAENVSDGETGFVVPRRNSEALADRLQLLASEPTLRSEMGRAGRRRVVERFKIEQQIAAFRDLYLRLLAGSEVLGGTTRRGAHES